MRPILGTLIAIRDNKKIFLIKRAKEPYVGLWGLPAGKIEIGEHVEDTAVREAKEETGLDTKFVAVRGVLSEILTDNEKTSHFYNFVTELKPLTYDLVESDGGELKWVEIDKLEQENLIPSEWSIVKDIILNGKSFHVHKAHIKRTENNYTIESFK